MRILLLQDDSFFPPQAAWRRTDGSATILSDPAATAVLEQHFDLDLSPLRRVADADEGDARRMVGPWLWEADQSSMTAPATVPAERWAAAHALLAARRAENELAWTTPPALSRPSRRYSRRSARKTRRRTPRCLTLWPTPRSRCQSMRRT